MKKIHLDNFAIPVEHLPIAIQNEYAAAELAVETAPAGPLKNAAKAKLNEVAKKALVAYAPHLLFKASPNARGASGFYSALAARSLSK
jgi:hypothetical protein